MTRDPRRDVTIPLWALLALTATWGVALMMVGLFVKQKGMPQEITSMLLLELGKAAAIGVVFGYLVRSLFALQGPEGRSALPLAQSSIEGMYLTRQQAASTMLAAVKDPRTVKLWVAGISLRDFFLAGGTLNSVWDAIGDRIEQEDKDERPLHERLKVRILLLDPWCPEGDFRFNLEQLPQGLRHDVPLAVRVVLALSRKLKAANDQIVAIRLYQHGSFAFQFITDSFALVEQYTYRDQKAIAGVPIIQYSRLRPSEASRTYHQNEHSYRIVWEHSRPAIEEELEVGVGSGLRESRLRAIYRSKQEERDLLGSRQRAGIRSSGSGDIIDIQAISGRYYARNLRAEIESIKGRLGGGAKIRLLVTNPTSRSAILRAVADETALEDIGVAIRSWTWDRHRVSQLYSDVHETIRIVTRLRAAGCDIDLRLSAADLSCAMFKGRNSLFVEQYAYGRSQNYKTGLTLGGEYDAFEYERGDGAALTSGESILESAFDVLWDSYSMSGDEYFKRKETDEQNSFQNELSALAPQLGSDAPDNEVTMVILAAGYGVRIADDLERTPGLKGLPKALLPVRNIPMVEWLLRGVEEINQVRRIVIVTNDLYAEKFATWRNANSKWEQIRIVSDGTKSNAERRGAIGALRFAIAREEIRGNVFVVGADNFFPAGFKDVVKAFLEWRTGVVVVHDEGTLERVAGRLGVVGMNENGFITDFEEKPNQPKSTLASTLCYVLTESDVRQLKGYVRDNPQADNSGDFIRHLVFNHQRIKGFKYEGDWRDIGTFAEYQGLCRLMDAADPRLPQVKQAAA